MKHFFALVIFLFSANSIANTPPAITGGTGEFVVAEQSSQGTLITTLTAEDADGDNFWFEIVKGNSQGLFGIDNAGQLTITADLTGRGFTGHELIISATDGMDSVKTRVIVSVISTGATPGVTRHVWKNITGSDVSDMTSIANYPETPDVNEVMATYEAPSNWGANYGQRVFGYVIPPADGDYTFFIRSDDQGQLFINQAGAYSDTKTKLATSQWYTDWRPSSAISLKGGRPYFIEALHKEAGGGDNLTIAWSGPNFATRTIIDGAYLFPLNSLKLPLTTPTLSFSAQAKRVILTWEKSLSQTGSVTYQIFRDNVLVTTTDQTTYSDTGLNINTTYRYKVVATSSAGESAESDEITVVTSNSAPAFIGNSGHYAIAENAPVGSSVGFVKALDTDIDDTLTYSLTGNNSDFEINATSGEITLKNPLNRSLGVQQSITVSVTDQTDTDTQQQTILIIPAANANSSGIFLEHWKQIGSNDISKLTSNPNYPDNPSQTSILTEFETPSKDYGNYGQRVSGYLRVAESAEYTFWIASDDNSELRLASNSNPDASNLIASVTGWTRRHQWDKFTSQKSQSFYLVAGRLYYIEALHKEGGGGDHVEVALQKKGETTKNIIVASQMIPRNMLDSTSPSTPLSFGTDLVTANAIALSWQAAHDLVGKIASYEIYRDGILIATVSGDTLSYTDNSFSAGDTHTYQILAVDDFGNKSTTAQLSIDSSNYLNTVENAIKTGDSRKVFNVNHLIDAAIAEIDDSLTVSQSAIYQIYNLNADGSIKNDGTSLTSITWDPSWDAALLNAQTNKNASLITTNAVVIASKTVDNKTLAVLGETQSSRYIVMGSNPMRNAQRKPASLNDQMHQLLENSLTWLTGRNDLKQAPFNVVIAHMDQSLFFPDEVATRNWLDAHYPGQVTYNARNSCEGSQLSGCLANNPDLLIISQITSANDDIPVITQAVQQAIDNGIPVLYLHHDGNMLPLGTALFNMLNVSHDLDNRSYSLSVNAYNPLSFINVLPDRLNKIKILLKHLRNADFDIDWSACIDNEKCDSVPSYADSFLAGALNMKKILNKLDRAKIAIFSLPVNNYRFEKLLVLIGDHFRQDVRFPMSRGITSDTELLKSFFSEHATYNMRLLNPVQPDMGNFSRSDFSHVTPTSRTVNLVSKRIFRSTGAYAIPGVTFTVTRNDSSNVKVKVFINSLRDTATHIFAPGGYLRPRITQTTHIEIKPGETFQLTSAHGGPIQLQFDANDQPVELQFDNIGEHAYWSGSADNTSFTQKLDAGDFDWAEVVTPGFEIHSKLVKMRESMNDPKWGSAEALAAGTMRYMHNFPHVLAGFQGPGIDVVPEIHDFAAAKGWTINNLDVVKHMNADQATCGYGCSGNPYDAYWSYDPIAHGDVHELGHGLQGKMRFDGWANHTMTNFYSYFTKSKYHETTGKDGDCGGINFDRAFDVLQASRTQADPFTYLQTAMWNSYDLDKTYAMFIQMMMAAQDNGALENGWYLRARLHIIEREFWRAQANDTLWAEKQDSLGFAGYSRSEATDTYDNAKNDWMAIAISTITQRDFRNYLKMWGIPFSSKADAQIASFGYPAIPLKFYISSDKGYCTDHQNGDYLGKASLPVDGTQSWPAEIDSDNDGYWDAVDNCPMINNPSQSDSNNDGIGDMCTLHQLPDNTWQQISIPADLGDQQTVNAVFGDDLPPENYGSIWIIFAHDAPTGGYLKMNLDDTLTQGKGYWIIQKTGSNIGIDLPVNASETTIIKSSQCSSSSGCFEIPLLTSAAKVKWNMLGYPFERTLQTFNKARVVTNSGICSDQDGCSLDEAAAEKIFHSALWRYNGTRYVQIKPTDSITSWMGAWGATQENAHGLEPRLLIPLSGKH
jgi:hypothetical protein